MAEQSTGIINRRQFASLAGAAGLVSAAGISTPALAQGAARVVVIGGGPGGITVASQLKASDARLDVTLVEPKTAYTSCFYSNTYIGGFRSFASLTHGYDGVSKRGITVVHDMATGVDTVARTVKLAKSETPLAYDRLVVAPGIDLKYETIEGYSREAAEIMPHAWTGGRQTWLLKQKLLAIEDGGVVVMTVPENPYRCPPGPYERACMIGNVLKAVKPKSKLILFDAKATFSKQSVFEEAFREYYKDIIEINLSNEIDDFAVARVDVKTGEVVTKSGRKETAALANIIPAQRAGQIANIAGLTEGDWCPISPGTFRSTRHADIYVLGDAAIATEMPKSAFSAISQGTAVAAVIQADLRGAPLPESQFRNTCWSMLAANNSVKIGADYAAGDKDGHAALVPRDSFISKPGESNEVRAENHQASFAWYASTVTTLFGESASK